MKKPMPEMNTMAHWALLTLSCSISENRADEKRDADSMRESHPASAPAQNINFLLSPEGLRTFR